MTTFYALERSVAIGAVVSERAVVPPIIVVVETKATGGSAGGKLFLDPDGRLIGETVDGEQVELSVSANNG